jgi:predicted regulator of Ras-like GTPase activity (Roadblock/LC7/MglB family)
MAITRQEQITNILMKLQTGTPDIEGAAVISMDGLIVASSLPISVEEDRVSAMSAAPYGIGSRTAEELARGNIEQIYIKGDNGYMIITQAGSDAVLAVIANGRAKLGIIFLDIKRAADELSKII